MLYRAAHVLPVIGPPIHDGGVLVEGGRIRAVGRAVFLQREYAPMVEDLGDVVLIPGLVNAHCHLELTALAGSVRAGRRFAEWIADVIAAKAATPADKLIAGARAGAAELLAGGTTTVGDVVSLDGIDEALAGSPLRRVVFWEILGLGPRRAGALDRLRSRLQARPTADRVRNGVSPHAPYSTDPELYRGAAEIAAMLGLPITTHLAETTEEIEFLELGTGPLRELLDGMGLIEPGFEPARLSPLEFLDSVGCLNSRTLIAHMNHPGADDPARLAASGASVAYCPRAHEHFGRGRHPFRDLIDAGVNVCLGTDSAAGNSGLSMLAEMRLLHRRNRSLWPALILRMATLNGAAALGLGETAGALAPGYAADMVAVPYRPNGPFDPLENLLTGDDAPVRVMIAGRTVFGETGEPT